MHRGGDVGEEVVAGVRFQIVHAGAVAAPVVGPDARHVGHVDGDDARRGRHRACRKRGAFGQHHDDFAHVARHRDLARRDGGRSVGVGAGDDEEIVALRHQGAAIVFQNRPRPLVVIRALRHDVGHNEGGVVVGAGGGAIRRGAVVPPVVAAVRVIAGRDADPAGGQIGVGVEGVVARRRSQIQRPQVPRNPVGRSVALVVGERELRLLHQVVAGVGRAGGGARGVAHRQLQGRRGLAPAKAGACDQQADQRRRCRG